MRVSFKNKNSPVYDPTYKYGNILRYIINNGDYLSMEADVDCTINIISFATKSLGESGVGVIF